MNYSIDITVATKRDLADAFDYIDGMLMNPSAQNSLPLPGLRGVFLLLSSFSLMKFLLLSSVFCATACRQGSFVLSYA